MKYPPTHVLNPAFKYTPSAATNIALTFERVKAERQAKSVEPNVTQLKRKVKGA